MQRLKPLLAGVALALCLGSSSIFAQTETSDPPEDQVPETPVQVEDQQPVETQTLPEPLEVDSEDVETKPIAPSSATTETQSVAPKNEADPNSTTQQPTKPAAVKPKHFALTFDDLKFDKEKDESFDRKFLTPKINSYHGGKVKIRGYIRPNYKQSGITKFIFVRDNKECCFGPQAEIFDNILVRLEKGESTDYTVRPITVEGDFVLKEYHGLDGEVWSLYRLYNAEVK